MKNSARSRLSQLAQGGQAFWAARTRGERRTLGSGLAVVVLALLWWVGLSPALDTLRNSEAQHRTLDAQLQTMRSLAAQTAGLQALPRLKAEESARALDASVKQLGAAAQLAVAGDRATVTLKNVAADTFALWLAQTRNNARVLPLEAHLRPNAARNWDGTIVMALPPP
jgi:general secretion pathway protein M